MRALALTLGLLAAPAAADVLTVGVPGDHATIQAAVDAAANGDTILVRSTHTAGPVTIDAKGLTLVADLSDPNQFLSVPGPWIVDNVPAGRTVTLVGFRVTASSTPVVVRYNAGAVRLVRMKSLAGDAPYFGTAPEALYVTQSVDVTLTECVLVGGSGWETCEVYNAGDGGLALHARNSSVQIFGSVLQGGAGGDNYTIGDWYDCGGVGGAGGGPLRSPDAQIFASGTSFVGGVGGYGECGNYGDGWIDLYPSGSLEVLGSTTSPYNWPAATVQWNGAACWTEAIDPITQPGSSPIVVHGDPGALVELRISGPLAGPMFQLHNQPSAVRTLSLGAIPAGGTTIVHLPTPVFANASLGATFDVETTVTTAANGAVSSTVPWIVLDPSL